MRSTHTSQLLFGEEISLVPGKIAPNKGFDKTLMICKAVEWLVRRAVKLADTAGIRWS